jgi:hypothetical protein
MTGDIESNRLFATKLKVNFSIAGQKGGLKLDNIKFEVLIVEI